MLPFDPIFFIKLKTFNHPRPCISSGASRGASGFSPQIRKSIGTTLSVPSDFTATIGFSLVLHCAM